MKRMAIAAVLLALSLAGAGCASGRYASYERGRYVQPDTLHMMTKDDVIALSTAKVSDDVIIDQIGITGTYFDLSTQEIIDLAKAGVNDKVISAMMKTNQPSQTSDEGYSYYYPPNYRYAGYPYWYSWYPSFYLGFPLGYQRPYFVRRSYVPHYGNVGHGGSYGGGHGFSGGGHGFGGGRSGGHGSGGGRGGGGHR